jgi:hypothetical protein
MGRGVSCARAALPAVPVYLGLAGYATRPAKRLTTR